MGSGRKQTIGHNYFLGLHLILARQIDALLQIKMASKEAWRGQLKSGRAAIHKPNLFGGTKREGGFSGSFDLLDGNNAQPINDYLASRLGALVSAYRGVVSLVWRRPNIGANSARLPSMEFKLLNVAGIHRGWEVSTSVIGTELQGGGASIYIAMDTSLSMVGVRLATQKAALASFLRALKGTTNSVRIVAFSGVINGTNERFDCTDQDYEDLALWVEAYTTTSSGGDWNLAVSSASAFFTADTNLPRNISSGLFASLNLSSGNIGASQTEVRRKVVIFTTDGLPTSSTVPPAVATLAAIPGVEVFAFNIDETNISFTSQIDNTPSDGVPIISGSDPDALLIAFTGAMLSWADMNPAHIIRCLWTDPMRGGIAQTSEIGTSFEDAADLFFAEGFGLSVPFRGADAVDSDRLEVERHVDAITFRSRRTGKIEIKPIRNDYNPVSLPVLNSAVVLEWSGLERAMRSETPNQLTVIYTKRENGEAASVTRTNTAGVRRSGRIIPSQPVEYPFCTIDRLATRLCLRDLSVQDRPLLSGTLRLAYLPVELEIGEPFVINEPLLGINNVVVRILELQEGDGRDNSVTVRISEDRFALPLDGAAGLSPAPPTPVAPRAEPSPHRIVQEAPYYLMVLDQTQDTVDDALAAEPDLGVLLVAGSKATPAHFNITVAVDAGAGYEDEGDVEFAGTVLTLSALTSEADDIVVTVPASSDITAVSANSLAVIGTEIIRIDAVTDNGANVDLTIGRGCLDTVPVAHAIGDRIIFLQVADPLETQYVAPDAVAVKMLTNLNENQLSLYAAPVNNVTFASRAIRPYPPGRFKVNGSYEQDQTVSDVVLTWVHRDRTLQTTLVPEDHDDLGIGPEAGTTYRVRAEALNESGAVLSTVTDVNVGGAVTYDWDDTTVLPAGTARLSFTVTSVRGGYESWQSPRIAVLVLQPPADLSFEVI